MRLITPTPLGKLLIVASKNGVCEIGFVPDATPLAKEDNLQNIADYIIAYLHGKNKLPKIQLDIQGTDFQQSVWHELLKIPHGTTINYKQLAANVGNPKAIRAVANACASNKIMLFIPCHRVIRENGEISGYRFGVERKKQLLELERKYS